MTDPLNAEKLNGPGDELQDRPAEAPVSTAVPRIHHDAYTWQLPAEEITLRIRWFGLCVGYVLVNFGGNSSAIQVPQLNWILTLGAIYALADTYFSFRGRVFLGEWPLIISVMEALFIGLLCHYDAGLNSPFRFYYLLSLIVCSIRHSPQIAYLTLGLHLISYSTLLFSNRPSDWVSQLLLMIVWMGWVAWASIAFSQLVKRTSMELSLANSQLKQNQELLEDRIARRTSDLQESQALLVQQEKHAAFGLLAAGIAHEVGNPLAGISSLVQLLNRHNNDEYTNKRLDEVDAQLRRIQRILRELIDFSRPATTERNRCQINELITESLNISKYYKRKKGKNIITRFAEDLPVVQVVRDQLVQVFLNLILNAMDATEEGESIEITTEARGGQIVISIHDDGEGIREEDKARLFQPYFTTKAKGTGLGLFVCKNILEHSNSGTIEIDDTVKDGARFIVSLNCEELQGAADIPPGPAKEIKFVTT
ncbi:sensor histidine kinase [Gimesia maris]|jgi:signal transduction histidine kinase|uniref:histidine kinase n=1 Tax=Gimesia maris TaxID=122 RepID=A0A3D3QZI6_9PLAN|nr:ATP-binding protein [Gimesia maris]MAC53967.1 two-component sensor histidine kinase [Gimesia sp.]QDT80719.1 Sensor protein ZraS [Gimesia maris]HCO21985.1 two-component sensor histidine kinase [Gimesia maris]|tara:strand:+ start:115128 stop:116570 length:1443 start_codon:yes stop_codon:yes gene_type:complete